MSDPSALASSLAATSLAWAPLLDWSLLGPLLGLAAATLLLGLVRRARGILWRALVLALLALALLNPSLVHEQRQALPDVALVVVDQSPSQALGQRRARTATAAAELERRLAGLPDLELRTVHVGGADPATDPAAGAGAAAAEPLSETRLFEAVERALADVPRQRRAGVVLITDGQVHDVPTDPATAAAYGPVHTLLTGERGEADRRLSIVSAPSFGIVGKPVTLTFRVDDLGAPKTAPDQPLATAAVTVRRNGAEPEVLTVPLGRELPLELTLDHGGANVVELVVEPGPHELTLANNRAAAVINGVRDRLRVLLVSGEPYPGERTWRNLLKADPSVDLVHFTILRPPEKQDGTPIRELSLIAFPIRELFEVKLDEFDLIIFDRYRRPAVLPLRYLDNIARYVEHGGALLEASGPADSGVFSLFETPLGAVLPAEPTGEDWIGGFRPAVTEPGQRHPVTAGLAGSDPAGPGWGRWFRLNQVQQRRGVTLLTGPGARPLLILDRVGQGRVAQLTSDQIWLWSRGVEGGGPQAELLRRLAHWLMKEPALEEDDLRASVDGQRITLERRSLDDELPPLTVTTPSDHSRTLALTPAGPGRAGAVINADEPGLWRFADGSHTALAVVGATTVPEQSDLRTTPDLLAGVTAATGGGVVWLADGEHLDLRRTKPERARSGRGWLGFPAHGDYQVTGLSETPLVPASGLLLLTLAALLLAWRREGR